MNSSIGHYKIVEQIGAGGMGEVYLAEDARLRRKVALKFLPANFTQDADRVRRFEQEACAASALNHPNILTIHEIGAEDETHYIATEYIEGETLRGRMMDGQIRLAEVLDVATQVASALSAAHAAGIIHRDIKPENIMLRRDGFVKVLDFGLAKLSEQGQASADTHAETRMLLRTEPGLVMGTPAYMSPEQARGLPVDARTDVWSLGCVLYEMLAGRTPFDGETIADRIASIINNQPAPLSGFVENIPAPLEEIVYKCLEKDRGERYHTAKDLLADLRRLGKQVEFAAELERNPPANNKTGDAPEILKAVSTNEVSEAQTIMRSLPAQATTELLNQPHRTKNRKRVFLYGALIFLVAVGAVGYWYFNLPSNNIESIAVLPFVNESGNADVEYLSDGMTESLINSLSQLPKLAVKARSSVFRYKGKDTLPQQIAAELSVQAILNGRVVQRGNDLTLFLSLVDARDGNQLWGEQYNRKLTDLVSLQSEIARDVSGKLRTRLSGADERKVTKDYTENAEAYQLYLKGRFHVFKLTPPELQKGISYLQQAIEIDSSYALAYVGLSEAYRSLALAGEMNPNEFLPKAKAAAQKAIEIDDRLAEAHAALGVTMFWYDWRWDEAENQYRRALELNPNGAINHVWYAHLLSNTGRHREALAAIKRARELDPLSPFANALEGQFLLHAGRTDEALDRLQKTVELDPNFYFPHIFAVSAYVEKGMYPEAAAEARRARELSPNQTMSVAYGGYALAKAGKRDEARAVIEELIRLSKGRFVPPYHIALVYNGLGETDEALAWLEKGYQQRDPKMAFLKVEPKWNNLRDDPRFVDVLRRVGFSQ